MCTKVLRGGIWPRYGWCFVWKCLCLGGACRGTWDGCVRPSPQVRGGQAAEGTARRRAPCRPRTRDRYEGSQTPGLADQDLRASHLSLVASMSVQTSRALSYILSLSLSTPIFGCVSHSLLICGSSLRAPCLFGPTSNPFKHHSLWQLCYRLPGNVDGLH
jgi:hypothetical protein